MDAQRFDALARALWPASRRSLLGGAIGGMLGIASLALGGDESSAARRNARNRNGNNNRRRRRRRRNRGQTWTFKASLSHTNESPPSSGDRFSSGSTAQIRIVQRRRRSRFAGSSTISRPLLPIATSTSGMSSSSSGTPVTTPLPRSPSPAGSARRASTRAARGSAEARRTISGATRPATSSISGPGTRITRMVRLRGYSKDSRNDHSDTGTSAAPSAALVACRGTAQLSTLLAAPGV